MKENFYHLYWNGGGAYCVPLKFEPALLEAKAILNNFVNYPNTTIVEIRPADSKFGSDFYIGNNQSYYLHKLKNNKGLFLEFLNGFTYIEVDKEQIHEYLEPISEEINEKFLPPIDKIREANARAAGPIKEKTTHNPKEITLLLEPAEIVDLIILLNFIKPANKEVEKYFKQELIDKLKSQLGLAIRP